jgi:hypothetical protein
LAQVEEDQEAHTLLVATVEGVNADPPSPTPTAAAIHIKENNLFVQLGEEGDGACTRWILDSGATNHMTGAQSAFAELDDGVRGSVRFGDGSTVGIEGRGTVLFKCKTGEHHKLEGVYHIPRLTANIVSLGQLEEAKCKIAMEDGVLKIWDPRRRLLAAVRCGVNRLYVLDTNVDKPVCLALRTEEAAWRWHARYGHLGLVWSQAWYGHKPTVHFFRTFGCVADVKTVGGHLRKLDDRSTPMVFIGYESGTKEYRLYNSVTDCVHVSRDVVFEEGRAWNWEQDGEGSSSDAGNGPFIVEYEYIYTPGATSATPGAETVPHAASRTPSATSSGPGNSTLCTPVQLEQNNAPEPAAPGVEFASPPSRLDLEDDHDEDAPLRFRTLDNILDRGPALLGEAIEWGAVEGLLVAVGDGEPATFEEARREESWIKAMKEEMASIEQNNTWALVSLPRDHKAIGLKWVFKLKCDEVGNIVKHKARLVAKGYVQQ